MRYCYIFAALALVLAGLSGAVVVLDVIEGGHPIQLSINLGLILANLWNVITCIKLAARIRRQRDGGTAFPTEWGTDRLVPNGHPETTTRARELLLRLLTPEQREDYLVHRRFSVRTDIANYILIWGSRVVVKRPGIDNRICIIFGDPGTLPEEDRLIAILLMIRTEEVELWRRFGGSGGGNGAVQFGAGMLMGGE